MVVAWCQEEVGTEEATPQSCQGSVPSGLLCEAEGRRGGSEGSRGKGGEGGKGGQGRKEGDG